MPSEADLLNLLRQQGARDIVRRGDLIEARWRGVPVRVSVRVSVSGAVDTGRLAAAFAALSALPDPIAVAEIDLVRQGADGRRPVFVPVVSCAEGEALALLSGDSFLVILDRDTGAMTVLGTDIERAPFALQHRLPRATPHGDPARLAKDMPLAPAAPAEPKWRRLLPLLRCVRCPARAPLVASRIESSAVPGAASRIAPTAASSVGAANPERDALACTGCGERYAIRSGTPILLRDPAADGEPPPGEISSNSYSRQALALMDGQRDGWVLDCGCGQPADNLPHVVNLEILRFPNVDIVASAAALPFADGAFDAAICESVLEHVPDPWAVAAELHRVLKPGGVIRVDAPFIAPFHAFPDHYHNFTRTGLDRLLAGFEKLDGGIGPHQEPWVAFGWILRLLREGLPDETLRRQLDATPVGELLQSLSRGVPPATLHPLDDATRLALAAGFFFYGRKRAEREPLSP